MNKNMKNSEDLISIIVPVYKTEAYLNSCIESIVKQTYQNLEIILVNDGSPDECASICDMWKEKDCRIKVIHQVNKGSAQARNVALDIVKGVYVAFIDSDDMMNCNMLEVLHNIAVEQNADIVECEYSTDEKVMFDNDFTTIVVNVYNQQDAMLEHVRETFFRQVIWNKLYKSTIVKKLRFVEKKVIDDEFWTYRAIGNATKLVHIQKKMYFYRQQDQSIMHQKYSLKRLAGVEAHVERHRYINSNFPRVYEESLIRLWHDCRYHGQMVLLNLNNEDRKIAFDYLNNIIKCFPVSYKLIFCQATKEMTWLVIEKLSLKLVCRLRNILRIGV